jgi:hypothetical protein
MLEFTLFKEFFVKTFTNKLLDRVLLSIIVSENDQCG